MQGKIIENLDRFIRKYYKSRLIRGGLFAAALALVLFLVIVLLEYFGYFSTSVRACLFWGYWLALAGIVGGYVVVPLLRMRGLGKVLSYDDAARIVGDHFPEIKDKLLNLLQLTRDAESLASRPPAEEDEEPVDTTLLLAAVEQKTAQLSPIPFANAVDLRVNRKYVKYAAIPLAILLILLLAAPRMIVEPSKRLVHNTTAYERPAPFAFTVQNERLEAAQQEDFLLQVEVDGEAIPNEAFINVEGRVYRMTQVDKTHYTYQFRTLQRTVGFRLEAAGVVSKDYELRVYPKPNVVAFQAKLTYPAYTGKQNELITNVGDLSVPCGTHITWQFQTKDVDSLFFLAGASPLPYCPDRSGRLSIEKRAMESFDYGFSALNRYAKQSDTLKYSISVVADVAPMIMVMEMRDSLAPNRIYFRGRIKDDYGFTKLEFKLVKTNAKDTSLNQNIVNSIGVTPEASQEFYYTFNLNEITINPGDRIRYYFEVWDNDGIHGPKSAVSQNFEIDIPTNEELTQMLSQSNEQIESRTEQSIEELKKVRQEIDELTRRMIEKNELNWQDKKQLENLMKHYEELKQELKQTQELMHQKEQLEDQYRDPSEKIMEKQKELDKLIEQVMNDEMKELMQQIQQLMEEQDKKKVQQQLENLKMKSEDIERQLDQNIELMKRLEMEKKVEEAVKRAEELAQKQKELSQKTEDAKPKDKEELARQQEQLNKEFEQLKKEIDQIQKDYKKIDENIDFKVDKQLEQKIQQEQQGAKDSLQKGKNKDASKQQKEAAEDMEKLSEQLAEAQQDLEQSELAEDAEMVRQLLKNIVNLSFNQEALIGTLNSVYIQDPKYQQIIKDQNIVKEDFRNVRDSLQAMARRQVAIAAEVNKEVSAVNLNISKSLSSLLQYNQTFYGNMKNTAAAKNMQYSMTSLNNLALMLAKSLDDMQSQMRQNEQKKKNGSCKNPGMKMKSGQCSNPGKSKPSAKSMKQMQQELNKQLEALKKQMDKQGQKPGQRTKAGQQGQMSEEFAKAAAQQEMIRRMMQQYGQELKQQNAGNSKLAKEIDEMMRQMEQTETDLVNKTITQQTIKRQQQIMTRLLEHERAEMEREKEERRESKEATEQYKPTPADMERFQKMQDNNLELFRTVPPTLSPFYKNKVNEYFYKF